MNRILLVVLFCWAVSLFGQFYDPVQINQENENVFFRGSKACKIINDEIYLVFVEDSLAANLYFSHSPDGISFENMLIDQNVETCEEALPTIEVMESGKILIYYCKAMNSEIYLYDAVSYNNGSSFTIEQLDTNISEFSSTTLENETYLSFKKDSEINFSFFNNFTDTDESENADGGLDEAIIPFWGADVLYGPVHINSDLWIAQFGGGINNGWPTFYGQVVTNGIIRLYPSGVPAVGNAPMEQIFLGGWRDSNNGVTEVQLPETAEAIRQNGIQVGDAETDIIYVKMCGSSAETMFGEIVEVGVQEFPVYSWFPKDAAEANWCINYGGNWYEDSDHIWTNEIAIYDTVWTAGPTLSWTDEATFWIPDAELWIEGGVAGNVTWGCGENAYIVNDIYYANTTLGSPPDDEDDMNPTDYFGLVSEKRIFIKYKHRDPFNENYPIVAPNCDGNVFLYGAYAAIGKGDTLQYGNMACHYDGIITPEYQHPHGSTPNFWAPSPYTGNDTLYTFIDFHKFVFPHNVFLPNNLLGFNLHGNNPISNNNNTCGFPYESPDYQSSFPNNDPNNYVFPYGTDYPWLNPVWPEPATNIVLERGTIHLWGSFVQRRRGFIHRSGIDPYNHPGDNEWDLENFHYDGYHGSTGYATKDYHYDSRFTITNPIDFPSAVCENYQTVYVQKSSDEGNTFEPVVKKSMKWESPIMSKDHIFSIGGEHIILQPIKESDKIIYSFNEGEFFSEIQPNFNSYWFTIQNIFVSDALIYIFGNNEDGIFLYEYENLFFEPSSIYPFTANSEIYSFNITENSNKVFVTVQNPLIQPIVFGFDYTYEDPLLFNGNYTWQTPFNLMFEEDSKLDLNFDIHQNVYVSFLNSAVEGLEYGDLWLTKGSLPNLTGTEESQIPFSGEITLSNYPNPFNPSTIIEFQLNTETAKNTELVIYNLKGQKVKVFTFPNGSLGTSEQNLQISKSPNHQIVWDGTDQTDKPVGTGIYFCKLKVDGKDKLIRKMMLIK